MSQTALKYMLSDGAINTIPDVMLTRQTKLSELHKYPLNVSVAYPSTGQYYVGHLIPNNPSAWRNIQSEIQYSLGSPRGQVNNAQVHVLVNELGETVPCIRKFATCQGIKICPFMSSDISPFIHSRVTADSLEKHRQLLHRSVELTAEEDVYMQTLALWSTFRDYGCLFQLDEVTAYVPEEYLHQADIEKLHRKAARGAPSKPTCKGQLHLLKFGDTLMHLNFMVSAASYDTVYFQALFNNDKALLEVLEGAMKNKGYGPLVSCTTVQNCTSVKVNCESHHRSPNGSMTMTELRRLPCTSSITIYEPLPDYRSSCPYVLIVCKGVHTHPVPIPARTPSSIVDNLIKFLTHLDDLPNLTARRLLGNEAAKFFLKRELPNLAKPTFSDLHPSLGNLDHMQVYINRAIISVHPHGTGWEGLLHLKMAQDASRAVADRYIRYAQEIRLQCNPGDVEDTQLLGQVADPNVLRLIICIKSENSLRLIRDARHIQSDISFKRIAGWLEFELGGFDRVNMFAVVYARAYLNRQTAEAHKIMLLEIDRIVYEDTGKRIQYRHLHATSSDDIEFPGILSWSVDQHRGQAKGIGEYLQAVAPYQKYDLYEPTKLLSELGPYEHLRRILRLCFAHYARNIQKSVVSQEVKDAMFSLHGVIHKDGTEASWQATLSFIEKEGKKAGRDWVQDKIESKFAFPALCWQVAQQIPFKVWQASDDTTNVIEGLHQDQLRDGSSLTLLGGLLRGEQYDDMRLQNLKNLRDHGVSPRYQPNNPSAQAYRMVSRQTNSKKRQFDTADTKIHEHNNKVRRIGNEMRDAREGVQEAVRKVQAGIWSRGQLERAENKVVKLETQYTKLIQESQRLKESGGGSGKVKVQEV
ncbi:hypothetical protein F5879DRAFT_900538 [Lentinula edodes]|nr:hypothetical protein F5879DRAFT_900538 [Lentinula edodes]